MTNYGLPLRFKAVEISTGKEVPTSKLVLDLSDGQWLAVYGGDTIRFDEEWPTDLQIYQSTGHHDANGAEVFFGDVLLWNSKTVVVCGSGAIELATIDISEEDVRTHWPFGNVLYGAKISEAVAIGNIHTPPAELQRRAQEVLNA